MRSQTCVSISKPSNNGMQRTAFRAAADAERWADKQ
jgi:hypothetical protein